MTHRSWQLSAGEVDYVMLMQDVVTRGGKFVFLYKRPGRRVMLNAFGQMMVAPTLLETSVRRSTTGKCKGLSFRCLGTCNDCMHVLLCFHAFLAAKH